jgi:hypothetical protein
MFFEGADGGAPVTVNKSWSAMLVVAASLAFVVGFIVVPEPLAALCANATAGLLP